MTDLERYHAQIVEFFSTTLQGSWNRSDVVRRLKIEFEAYKRGFRGDDSAAVEAAESPTVIDKELSIAGYTLTFREGLLVGVELEGPSE